MGTLALRSVAVGIRGHLLLEGVELTVATGERVAVTGPSGCGKTTLLRAVAGLIDPAGGELRLDGRRPADIGWPEWRRRVTYVSQRPVMLEGTVERNLRRPFEYKRARAAFPQAGVHEWLERMQLGSRRWEQEASTLSVGEQQRVALVRALAHGPEVLLLDEPTSALDAENARRVHETLAEWVAGGGATLAVTHDASQAEQWHDRRRDLGDHVAGRN